MSDSLTLEVVADLGHVNLRGDADDADFRTAAEEALGQPLPIAANTISTGDHTSYWLGPDEWLLATARDGVTDLVALLDKKLEGLHSANNDVSGGNVVLDLTGAAARDVLAKGCTLDLHPRVFTRGSCAQSGLGKAIILLGLIDDTPTFRLTVRRSFADYLQHWLQHAGAAHGIELR